jgi:hypothetical protein
VSLRESGLAAAGDLKVARKEAGLNLALQPPVFCVVCYRAQQDEGQGNRDSDQKAFHVLDDKSGLQWQARPISTWAVRRALLDSDVVT